MDWHSLTSSENKVDSLFFALLEELQRNRLLGTAVVGTLKSQKPFSFSSCQTFLRQ